MYTIAVCPYCKKACGERIDTYTLREWELRLRYGQQKRVFFDETAFGNPLPEGVRHYDACRHYMLSQRFIHLNGHLPERVPEELEFGSIDLVSEAPHVMGVYLSEDVKTKAVIHSLPICKIMDGEFVPRYTLYMVSYFCASWWQYRKVRGKYVEHMNYLNKQNRAVEPLLEGEHDDWWELRKWVAKGRLLWMEPDNPNPTLRAGPVAEFPYANIEGRRWPYIESSPVTYEEANRRHWDEVYDRIKHGERVFGPRRKKNTGDGEAGGNSVAGEA